MLMKKNNKLVAKNNILLHIHYYKNYNVYNYFIVKKNEYLILKLNLYC